RAAFERSSAISGDKCVQSRTHGRDGGKENLPVLEGGKTSRTADNKTPTDSGETRREGHLACTAAHHQQRQHAWSVR
ncbi:unnamed protein product, partial [Ectocarpus sp. 12 AP-2014]